MFAEEAIGYEFLDVALFDGAEFRPLKPAFKELFDINQFTHSKKPLLYYESPFSGYCGIFYSLAADGVVPVPSRSVVNKAHCLNPLCEQPYGSNTVVSKYSVSERIVLCMDHRRCFTASVSVQRL